MKNLAKIVRILTNASTYIILVWFISCDEAKTEKFKTSEKFSLLWEITGTDLRNPSYLFGSWNIYDPTIFTIPAEIFDAIDLCDNFVMEIDPKVMICQEGGKQNTIIANPDNTLDKLLEPEVYAELLNLPVVKLINVDVRMVNPMFITMFFQVEDPDVIYSVDRGLSMYAMEKLKNTIGLETLEEQLDMIDNIPMSEQIKEINDVYNYCKKENIRFVEAGKKMFVAAQNIYKSQDLEKFDDLNKEFNITAWSSGADSAMFASRNIKFANRIDDFIRQNKTIFIAIGQSHLPNRENMRGIVTLLKEKGYKMRPLLIDLNIDQ
jgi:uncharacterized protein YbaP (TraB family)